MKPITTYCGILATSLAAAILTFREGFDPQGYLSLVIASAVLMSFQGRAQFYRPAWAEGIEFNPPATGGLLSIAIIVEAAALIAAIEAGTLAGMTIRTVGGIIQFAAIGKISRDFLGASAQEEIEATIQDSTLKTK